MKWDYHVCERCKVAFAKNVMLYPEISIAIWGKNVVLKSKKMKEKTQRKGVSASASALEHIRESVMSRSSYD